MRRQQQRGRPQPAQEVQPDPIKYGDVFDVSGELASQPVAPQDAATMQAAESHVLGHPQKAGPAAVMQSAASKNVDSGAVARGQVTPTARDEGVTVSEANVQGKRIVTEAVGGEVVGQYIAPEPVEATAPGGVLGRDAVTIGEALESTALSAGEKPVDRSDAAAIQAAEVRATGRDTVMPGGVAAQALSAANQNRRTMAGDRKTTLSDVLADATTKLPGDKPVTREDAEGVIGAELRNNPSMATYPGGVAESIAAAARINQNK